MTTKHLSPPVRHGRAQHGPTRHAAPPTPAVPWGVVEGGRLGRLRYARAQGTMALPVRYVPCDHRLVLRLPEYNDAVHFLDRADVAIDVDTHADGRPYTVRVTGVGLVLPRGSVRPEVDAELEHWPDGVGARDVMIVVESVHWLPTPDDARYPPLPSCDHRLPSTYGVG